MSLFARLSRSRDLQLSLLDQVMVSGGNFLLGIFLARGLGVSDYGVFVLAWTAVLFFSSVQQGYILAPLLTFGPTKTIEEQPAFFGAALAQQLLFSAAASLLILMAANVYSRFSTEMAELALAAPLAAVSFAYLNQDFLRRLFFARRQPHRAVVVDAIAYGGQLLVGGAVIVADIDDTSVVLSALAGTFMVSAAAAAFYCGPLQWSKEVFVELGKENWLFSKWLVGAALLQWLTGNLFLIAAGALLGTAASGAIRAAQNIMGSAHVVFLALENYLPVRMSVALKEGGKPLLWATFRKMALRLGFFTAVISGIVIAAPQLWLRLAYGDELVPYGWLLRWFAILYLVISFTTVLRLALRALGVTRPVFMAQIGTAALSTFVAFPVVEALGLAGVMAGLFAAQAVTLACFIYYARGATR